MFIESLLDSRVNPILSLLAVFVLLSLVIYSPIYFFRYFRMRKIARTKGRRFRPSNVLLALNMWLILTVMSLTAFLIVGGYNKNNRRKPAEAKLNLGAIYSTQTAYFGEHNTYAGRAGTNGSGAFADIKWMPPEDTNYAYYIGDDCLNPTKLKVESDCKPGANWPYSFRSQSSAHGFTALAIGNLDFDPCMDIWSVNDAKELRQLADDLNPWDQRNAPIDCTEASKENKSFYANIYKVVRSSSIGILVVTLVLGSPAFIIVIPISYYLAILQNRLYREARAAMKAGPSREIGEKE
jgi:hypothetical protein